LNNYYRIKSAGELANAKNEAANGQYGAAKTRLDNFIEELNNSPVKNEKFIVNLIKDM